MKYCALITGLIASYRYQWFGDDDRKRSINIKMQGKYLFTYIEECQT